MRENHVPETWNFRIIPYEHWRDLQLFNLVLAKSNWLKTGTTERPADHWAASLDDKLLFYCWEVTISKTCSLSFLQEKRTQNSQIYNKAVSTSVKSQLFAKRIVYYKMYDKQQNHWFCVQQLAGNLTTLLVKKAKNKCPFDGNHGNDVARDEVVRQLCSEVLVGLRPALFKHAQRTKAAFLNGLFFSVLSYQFTCSNHVTLLWDEGDGRLYGTPSSGPFQCNTAWSCRWGYTWESWIILLWSGCVMWQRPADWRIFRAWRSSYVLTFPLQNYFDYYNEPILIKQ